jgi:Tol biopolymer transport system component
MSRNQVLFVWCAVLVGMLLGACGGGTTEETTATNYDDPFTYCAAVGTIDQPDSRYTGPEITEEVIDGYLRAADLQETTEPMEMLEQTTVWRCMDDSVYACNVGANLPCEAKADSGTSPSAAMNDYCAANPDSEFIPAAVTGRETIYSWHCVAGSPETLEQIDEPDAAGYLSRIWYRIEPAGTTGALPTGQILFTSDRAGSSDNLYLTDLTSDDTTALTGGDANTFAGPFSPDGERILYTGFGLTHSFIGVMSADGTLPEQLTDEAADDGFPAWSPDGEEIAFTSSRDGNNEIYVMGADGSGIRRVTDDPGDDFAPAWSPDGSQIAFVSDRGNPAGVTNLYVMDADGTNLERLTNGPEIDYSPAWSPDGTRIAFRAHHDGPADIYLIAPDGSSLVAFTDDPADDWAPAWSPDGRWIAFQTNRDGNWEIYVQAVDGGSAIDITENAADDQMPYWRPAVGLPNPASAHCNAVGGSLMIESRDDLGQIGVCYFEDNRQCEEWALLRGDCPVGGLKVTGYITEAARYCAITGGSYQITAAGGAEDEQGTCTLPDGTTVDAWEYYEGTTNPTG